MVSASDWCTETSLSSAGCTISPYNKHASLTRTYLPLHPSLFLAQGCIGANITFINNTARSGGDNAYLADAAAADALSNRGTGRAGPTTSGPKPAPQGGGQCTRQELNTAGSTLRVAGPPCALVLWSPAAGTLLPYVNNGSGLPTINATVVDCWCSTVQQIPGKRALRTVLSQSCGCWEYNSSAALAQAPGSWVCLIALCVASRRKSTPPGKNSPATPHVPYWLVFSDPATHVLPGHQQIGLLAVDTKPYCS